MENKHVGWLIIGIAVVMAIIVGIFNSALNTIVDDTCAHGPECTMYDTIRVQTGVSLAIIGIIVVIGLVIMFNKPAERIVVKKIKEKTVKRKINTNDLNGEEKKIIKVIEDSDGTIFQSDLVDNSGFSKVKISRILDKLENREIVERKRRGMTNVVVLK
ncbi:MAG: hypothetical protein KKF56_02165 [Nanoarchaeota archaeon]|nr:hypothetical protein [Nanoarchaeota archaeon]